MCIRDRVNADGSPKLSIANQFRDRGSMVYDFIQSDARLTLRITSRMNEDDPGEFRVDASEGSRGEVFVTAWGATRAAALAAVGTSWQETHVGLGLPMFDWEAVATALNAVRALR